MAPGHKRQALSGVLVDYGQNPDRPATGGLIGGEVVGPDVIWMLGALAIAGPVSGTHTPTFSLLLGHLEAFLAPDTLDAFAVDLVALPDEQSVNTAIAVSRVLDSKVCDLVDQVALVGPSSWLVSLD